MPARRATASARRPAPGRFEGAPRPRDGAARPGRARHLLERAERVYSTDVNYEYRQDSNLLYLTGIDQEETILVLMPGNATRREVLFVREADARREHWNGHSLTPAEAAAQSGIETVMTANQFEGFVAAALGEPGAADREPRRCSSNRSAILTDPPGPVAPVRGADARAVLRVPGQGRDADPQRAAADQDAVRAGRAAQERARSRARRTRRACAPPRRGKFEYEVEAAIEEVYMRNGAMSWGYPSIVGSGPQVVAGTANSPAATGGRTARRS